MTKEIRLYPHEHVELALQKRSVSGSSMSLMEFFGQSTPTGSGFWAAAAENLHERGLHTDAFDAWRAALQENADDDATRGKMAFSLEELARQEALSATLLDGVGLYEIVGLWRCVARILEWSGHRERALDAVHKALHLDLDVDWDYGVDLELIRK